MYRLEKGIKGVVFTKLSLFVAVCCILLVSCKTLSPFFYGSRTRSLIYCSAENSTVVYINLKKSKWLLKDILKIDTSSLSRFRNAVVVIDSDTTYGVLEGDVPKIARNIITSRLKSKKVKEGKLTCYSAVFNGQTILYDLVYPGVILFSTGSWKKAYDNFVSSRSQKTTGSTSEFMQVHGISMIAINPKTNGDELSEDVLKGSVLTADFDNSTNKIIMNGTMQFTSAEALNSLSTKMKNDMIAYIKNGGDRAEILNAMTHTKLDNKNFIITITDYKMPVDLFSFLIFYSSS